MFIQNCIQNISKNQEDLEMNDLISIIIPVYNAGKTIDSCIESVLKSTYSDFEILIIDDGSNAETADECDKVALKTKELR